MATLCGALGSSSGVTTPDEPLTKIVPAPTEPHKKPKKRATLIEIGPSISFPNAHDADGGGHWASAASQEAHVRRHGGDPNGPAPTEPHKKPKKRATLIEIGPSTSLPNAHDAVGGHWASASQEVHPGPNGSMSLNPPQNKRVRSSGQLPSAQSTSAESAMRTLRDDVRLACDIWTSLTRTEVAHALASFRDHITLIEQCVERGTDEDPRRELDNMPILDKVALHLECADADALANTSMIAIATDKYHVITSAEAAARRAASGRSLSKHVQPRNVWYACKRCDYFTHDKGRLVSHCYAKHM